MNERSHALSCVTVGGAPAGAATVFGVVTSQMAPDEAVANRVATRYDDLIARAELESLLGQER